MSKGEPASAPQLNSIREEYVTGSLDDSELEAKVEQALADGPPIGRDDRTASQATGWDAITTTIAGVFIAPFVRLVSWRQDSDGKADYDWSRHQVTIVESDPDPDAHPAESAGKGQAYLSTFALMFAMVLTYTALVYQMHAAAVALLAVYYAVLKAPKPTVDYTVSGFGRHVARGGTTEDE